METNTLKAALGRILEDGCADGGGYDALARALFDKAKNGDLAAIREIVAASAPGGAREPVVIIDDTSTIDN